MASRSTSPTTHHDRFYADATLAGFISPCSSSSIDYQEVTPVTRREEPRRRRGTPVGGQPRGGGGPGGRWPPRTLPTLPASRLRRSCGRPPTAPPTTTTRSSPAGPPEATRVRDLRQRRLRRRGAGLGFGRAALGRPPVQVADNTTVYLLRRRDRRRRRRFGLRASAGRLRRGLDRAARPGSPAGRGARPASAPSSSRFADTTGDPSISFHAGSTASRWKACHSPLRLSHLGHRRHMLRVKGSDAAGNAEERGGQAQLQGASAR